MALAPALVLLYLTLAIPMVDRDYVGRPGNDSHCYKTIFGLEGSTISTIIFCQFTTRIYNLSRFLSELVAQLRRASPSGLFRAQRRRLKPRSIDYSLPVPVPYTLYCESLLSYSDYSSPSRSIAYENGQEKENRLKEDLKIILYSLFYFFVQYILNPIPLWTLLNPF